MQVYYRDFLRGERENPSILIEGFYFKIELKWL